MQVFRLSFIKPNEDSEIALIYDDKIKKISNNDFILNDVGIEPLQVLTIEEFAAMSGLILKPRSIETNQQYMFCANVEDDTIITDLSISVNNQPSQVYTQVVLSDNVDGNIPQASDSQFSSSDNIYGTSIKVNDYFRSRNINPELAKSTYNNIFTSSLLRSLRRGETYKYGIVYYDKNGRRSDVLSIGDLETLSIKDDNRRPFGIQSGKLVAYPIGTSIILPQPKDKRGNLYPDIIGCQIVRRSSSELYQKTLLQVALARPVQQGLMYTNEDWGSENKSPFYPTGFLTTNDVIITPPYYNNVIRIHYRDSNNASISHLSGEMDIADGDCVELDTPEGRDYTKFNASTKNKRLFQIFSSEIDFRRDDVLNRLNTSDAKLEDCFFVKPKYKRYGELTIPSFHLKNGVLSQYLNWEDGLRFFGVLQDLTHNLHEGTTTVFHRDSSYKLSASEKSNIYWVFNYFDQDFEEDKINNPINIKQIKDIKIPGWNDGYTNIQRGGDKNNIIDAIKKYKQYTTTIDQYVYNNWISMCKYDIKPAATVSDPNETDIDVNTGDFIDKGEDARKDKNEYSWNDRPDDFIRQGYIGPGTSCFLIVTKDDFNHHTPYIKDELYTSICNITHSPKIENVQSEEHTTYFGFGNYFKLKKRNGQYVVDDGSDEGSSTMVIFDGDIYITPHEITTMYKTYNFESADTLQSTQITNYIPLESKVNTYFDYGQNLRNTNSANLIYEPGQIEGIMTQERPAHQYNMIYSDNDASNDVFTLISTDENETNKFPQRTYFSEPKTNGEFIDNFLIFKPASFIDVEGTYGQITELATNKNILYYWQEHAFGKFSVNERSLVNDTNGNTIMLGQAGILSRYDYIDTRYGMREGDRCECPVDDMVYWIDINNKAVVAGNTQQAINYGERLGVQNIINDKISTDRPYVHHDLQNDELFCKCLEDGEQVVFNTKYNIATSVYTRNYIDILNVKNHLYGIHIDKDSKLNITKYNYLDNYECSYLTPMALFFVVNPNASTTKVFDSQQIVPIKRNFGNIDKLKLTFETDLYDKVIADNTDRYTDREGNIIYNVPRWGNEAYGNRMRGKWMKVGMELEEPNINNYSCLSHVITKFRQSFS